MNIIKFENVSKRYKRYSKGGLFLRDRITHALRQLNPFNHRDQFRVPSSPPIGATEAHPLALGSQHVLERDFWALKNVSFNIKRGESVGFIGRNGAGKSTILKLLAQVTKPSSGSVEVNGRVAALIEVGAGFHPELTGRENVYLNGSILGMKKAEIDECFDSIVDFAELKDFIDTPVKHYSSGMYVRLGFAIATHSNPDIFLVDEVLSVGDAAFQEKCEAVFEKHKADGKTIVLVSHQLNNIEEVCDRCIYIREGEARYDGAPAGAIELYRSDLQKESLLAQRAGRSAGAEAEITNVSFYNDQGKLESTFKSMEPMIVKVECRARRPIDDLVVGIMIYGPKGELVTGFNNLPDCFQIDPGDGEKALFCRIPEIPFRAGKYSVAVNVYQKSAKQAVHYDNRRLKFDVVCDDASGRGFLRLRNVWGEQWIDGAFPQRSKAAVSPLPKRNVS